MILAIDIGNRYFTAGCMDGLNVRAKFRLSSTLERTDYEYAAMMRFVLNEEGIGPEDFTGAVLASVVPPLTEVVKSAVRRFCGAEAIVVGAGLKTGLNIKIDNPAQLGSDLAVTAVAALERYEPPLIVVDTGSTTTIAVIDSQSRYRGGILCPGVSMALDSLVNSSPLLPAVTLDAPKCCIGTNTVDAIKAGAIFGTAALIDGIIMRIECELGQQAQVVGTGRLINSILPYCSREIVCDEDLLMRGMAIIYEKNKKAA